MKRKSFSEIYEITEYILTKDIVQGCVFYLQTIKRMVDAFDDKRDTSRIKWLYSKTAKDLV